MPIYTLMCVRCDHRTEQGFTVSGFKAQEEQGFRFLKCSRCSRRATMKHDFLTDARSQVIHLDEYTFAENAPEERLVGKTVSRSEAKAILKKHGLVEAGIDAKRRSSSQVQTYSGEEIAERWRKEHAAKEEGVDAGSEETPAKTKPNVPAKQVDKPAPAGDTIVSETWPGLRAQAKRLGIKVPSTVKRPELERLVRERIAG